MRGISGLVNAVVAMERMCIHWVISCVVFSFQLSLYFDLMLAMCPGVNERDFRSGQRSGSYGKNVYTLGDIKTMRHARTILWKDLHTFRIKACKFL